MRPSDRRMGIHPGSMIETTDCSAPRGPSILFTADTMRILPMRGENTRHASCPFLVVKTVLLLGWRLIRHRRWKDDGERERENRVNSVWKEEGIWNEGGRWKKEERGGEGGATINEPPRRPINFSPGFPALRSINMIRLRGRVSGGMISNPLQNLSLFLPNLLGIFREKKTRYLSTLSNRNENAEYLRFN